MPKVIATAQVKDSARWLESFKTHIELFRKQTVINTIHFTSNSNNEVAILFEVSDIDKWFEVLESPETAAAMELDGVKKETVNFYVLDEKLDV